ncbi:AraC family transcriptional regulator [Treponema brennaborense]|uniref:Transcriptional regulator, AraC family n=1 Tax=Treponema brennaborense (strain DSM 12168 / CIP 105900 / DD5/3) TaxID=906968 RepID=F4LKP3_TREBD|nr:helix-turn-helix domain-containing protein [Treponema brennaborense]AEE15504.1 transcriptional regulator, AraC family [Treponema brennaborense DSM 12168]
MNDRAQIYFHYYGYEKCRPEHFYGPAVRAHYLVHFVLNGKGIYRTAGNLFHIHKNQAFLIRPGDVTFYRADKADPWEYVWLAFDGPEADRVIAAFFPEKDSYVCPAINPDGFQQYMRMALPSFYRLDYSQMELAGWFYLFFSCLRQKDIAEVPKEKKYLESAVNYIRYNYMRDINIDEISARIGIDRTYLYKILKKYENCSPKEYLMRRRVAAAKDMLCYSTVSVTEIASMCGFHDSSSFCKIFRRYEGKSPSVYRRIVREEAARQAAERTSAQPGYNLLPEKAIPLINCF